MAELRTARILVVDDDAGVTRMLRMLLESAGYQVHTKLDGASAIRYAAEERPDLIILDLRLPDMDGFEVCKTMRRVFLPWSVPIVMLTGMDQPVDQLRGFACGADVYLTKPCDNHHILRTIERLFGEMANTGNA